MSLVTVRRALLLGAIALGTVSCTENAGVSPSPTSQSLFAPQFTGNWVGTATLNSVTPVITGECVSPSLQTLEGSEEKVTLAISQDSSVLGGRLASATSGLACTYTGTSAVNTLALDAATCDAPELILRCADDVTPRVMEVIGSTIQGSISGGRVDATLTNAFNVRTTFGGEPVTRVTMSYKLVAAKP